MSYLLFEINDSPEKAAEYEEYLQVCARGVHGCVKHLLRALQLMSPTSKEYRHGVVFTLARHVAEEIDAVSILIEKGSVDPTKLHLRSALEAELGIRYILQDDGERRALAYHVKETRERLRSNERADAGTIAGQKVREQLKDDPLATEILDAVSKNDFKEENESLKRMLSRAPFNEINQEWQNQNGKYLAWHLLFGGPKSVRQLAYEVGKGFW